MMCCCEGDLIASSHFRGRCTGKSSAGFRISGRCGGCSHVGFCISGLCEGSSSASFRFSGCCEGCSEASVLAGGVRASFAQGLMLGDAPPRGYAERKVPYWGALSCEGESSAFLCCWWADTHRVLLGKVCSTEACNHCLEMPGSMKATRATKHGPGCINMLGLLSVA